MSTDNISKAQLEVWEWKQKAYEELQNVPREKWMEYIRNKTQPFIDEIMRKKKAQKK